jgi:hypothetical protein
VDYKFKIGDLVNVDLIDSFGKIISIEEAPNKLKKLVGVNGDLPLYKIDIGNGIFITTTEDSLEEIKIEQAPNDNLEQKLNT